MDQQELLNKRKEKALFFIKKRYDWLVYIGLAIIVFLAVRLRTRNLPGLRDITTGEWALGPDLDPWLFLRWAKYIVENGTLFAIDTMRYVPFGFPTNEEYLLHTYLIAWFHKIAVIFGSESVTYSAIIYPVFMFALTIIAFFFLVRKIFLNSTGKRKASIIALISSFFLTVSPALLPRTIAGIPEKEASAFLFLFLAFYFFIWAYESKTLKTRIVFSLLAGLSTVAMSVVWGGYIFIFYTLGPAIMISFLLGKVDKQKFLVYTIWLFSSIGLMVPFSVRYNLRNLLSSISTGSAIAVFLVILFYFIIFNTKLKLYLRYDKFSRISPQVFSLIVSLIVLAILSSIAFGFSFIPEQVDSVVDALISPPESRLIQTVAENRQPYFNEITGSFGPFFRGIPLIFWLFFIGSAYLFFQMISILSKKEKLTLTSSYVFFLLALFLSKYSPQSMFNGENAISIAFYISGFLVFIGALCFYYNRYYRRGQQEQFQKIEFSLIFFFFFFFLGIVSARAAVRTIMVLVPSTSIIVSYFVVSLASASTHKKEGTRRTGRIVLAIFFIFIATFSAFTLYNQIKDNSAVFVPSSYNHQWQKAMAWVRENTPPTAVFGHWWDYGYWLQSIGNRATILDGGNHISYWNHLMGRHVLTGTNDIDAIEFLYAHNATHFLIDSTDIGKYGAFSFIGSDASLDRRSDLPIFLKDPSQMQETKDSVLYLYRGGALLSDDIIYEDNGTRVFLPSGNTGIGGVLVSRNPEGEIVSNPVGLFVYQGQQYNLPLRYAFDTELRDFGTGVESGVYVLPKIDPQGNSVSIDPNGALIYLGERTVKSQFARLYLYEENNSYFKQVHSEDDLAVGQLKQQGMPQSVDIIYFEGIRGPIRIWKIDYQDDISIKEEYLATDYPKEGDL